MRWWLYIADIIIWSTFRWKVIDVLIWNIGGSHSITCAHMRRRANESFVVILWKQKNPSMSMLNVLIEKETIQLCDLRFCWLFFIDGSFLLVRTVFALFPDILWELRWRMQHFEFDYKIFWENSSHLFLLPHKMSSLKTLFDNSLFWNMFAVIVWFISLAGGLGSNR